MINFADLPFVRDQLARDAAALAPFEAPPSKPATGKREITTPIQPLPGRLYVSAARSRVHSA